MVQVSGESLDLGQMVDLDSREILEFQLSGFAFRFSGAQLGMIFHTPLPGDI